MKTRNGFVMSGQSLVKYALMLAITSVASVLVMTLLGVNLGDTYCSVISGLNGNKCDCEDSICETISETTDNELEERICRYTFDDPATLDDWVQIGAPQCVSIENGRAIFTGTGRGGPRLYITNCTTQFDTSDLILDLKSVSIKRSTGPHHTMA